MNLLSKIRKNPILYAVSGLLVAIMVSSCDRTSNSERDIQADFQKDWSTQEQRRFEKQMEITDEQLARNDVLLNKQSQIERRWLRLIERWEKQADRYDQYLDRLEKHADSWEN